MHLVIMINLLKEKKWRKHAAVTELLEGGDKGDDDDEDGVDDDDDENESPF